MPEEYDEEYLRFFPYQLILEISALVFMAGVLLIASWFPAELRPEYDPFNPPKHIIPEWYFMAVYQVLKTKGFGNPINGMIVLTIIIVVLFAMPFIDRGTERHPLARPLATSIGLVLASIILGLTYLGFNTAPQELNAIQLTLFTLALVFVSVMAVRVARRIRFEIKGGTRR